MKKEKQVRSYKRRTKSGKIITVKAHTAKYEAADEKAKEVSKKPGAGKELEERRKKPVQLEIPFDKEEEKKVLDEVKETTKKESSKKPAEKKTTVKATRYASGAKLNEDGTFVSEKDYKKSIAHRKRKGARISPEEVKAIKKWESVHKESKVRPVGSGTNGPTPKRKSEAKVTKTTASKPATSEPAFTAAEFKEWYRGTGSAADKKVAKALRAQLGRSGYRKLEDEAIDNYSSRGHLSMFKRVSGGSSASTKSNGGTSKKPAETRSTTTKRTTSKGDYTPAFRDYVKKSGYELNKYGVLLKGGKPVENGYNITQSFAKAYRSGSKPTLPKQSSVRLTAVEKAYADYHKEQGRKGKPDYSSEEFMDFASTYKKQGSSRASKSSESKKSVAKAMGVKDAAKKFDKIVKEKK